MQNADEFEEIKMLNAKDLLGHMINGWKVIDKIKKSASDTGGNFSIGYLVQQDGVIAFLKALDYSNAFGCNNQAQILNNMTNAYLAEKEILESCNGKRMKYVIRILDAGNYKGIDYLIFERADYTVHSLIDVSLKFDYAWSLRSLHNIATGVNELHTILIAHQDIKPSNVLMFNNNSLSKLGDVGRASSKTIKVEHDEYACAGDRSYSPFEQLFGHIESDWMTRRFSCDMFMFGNLIYTYYNNISIVGAVFNKLPEDTRFGIGKNRYTYESILPQLQYGFDEALNQFNKHLPDEQLRNELILLIRKLCNPNIVERGEPNIKGPERFSLYKTISKLDYLSKMYEYKLRSLLKS
jgi:serine/threonine protein kinase